jgi:hypothetical protein
VSVESLEPRIQDGVSKLLNMSAVGGEELGRGRLQSVEWLLV